MKREDDIFFEASERPPDDRAAYLDEACGDDDVLRRRVERLLRASTTEERLIDRSPILRGAEAIPEQAGDVIDRYTLVRWLGEGGCGVVWLAEQSQPVRREVALKVIKLGMDTAQVIARFEAERRALALMDHPGIARVYDAGATEKGRPFFVMEFVDGAPITTYCDEHKLTLAERLGLFTQVCDAIQHAHQKGIIHRDVKPSNVLVATVDGRPVLKVIDFGIAKAIEGRLGEATLLTQLGQFMGTPAYMSPEQADLRQVDVDTRSDVYSLGVLLYELLTGLPPFESAALMQAGLDAMRHQIREVEPVRPSTRLVTLDPATLQSTASHRVMAPPKLVSRISGDLDWIVMRCLEKDRARRYDTAAGLADDIRRHLGNEPIVARPASAGYRLAKLVRRNRLAFAAAGAVMLALIGGIVASSWQAVRANRAEATARREAAIATAVSDFLRTDLLLQADSYAQADASAEADPELKVRTALDRAAAQVGIRFKDEPEVEAAVRQTIGEAYIGVGMSAAAAEHLRRAWELRRAMLGNDHVDTLDSGGELLLALSAAGRNDEGLALAEAQIATRLRLGNDESALLNDQSVKASLLDAMARHGEAESIRRAVLARREAMAEPDDRFLTGARQALARTLIGMGRYAEARELQTIVLARLRERFGSVHPRVFFAMNDLAVSLRGLGELDASLVLQEEACEVAAKVMGPGNLRTLMTQANLATTYVSLGRTAEAVALDEQALAEARRTLGDSHPLAVTLMNNLASAYGEDGRNEDARRTLETVLPMAESVFGPDHPNTYISVSSLGRILSDMGENEEALPLLERSFKGLRDTLGPEHPETIRVMGLTAASLVDAGNKEQGLALWRERRAVVTRLHGEVHPITLMNLEWEAHSLSELGRIEEAANAYRSLIEKAAALPDNTRHDTTTAVAWLAEHARD